MKNAVEAVRRQMEVQLLQGAWCAGMRIPSERKLAEQMGVSRATVREAISRLVARDMLASRPGSGVYVTDRLQAGLTSPWKQMLVDHPELRWDTLEFRLELEGAAAYFAALRATGQDLEALERIVARLENAHRQGNKSELVQADTDFHEAVAEASHNSMFRHLHAGVIRMLREHIALNLREMEAPAGEISVLLLDQHLAVWRAIRERQPDAARESMRRHIDFTWHELKRREAQAT